MQDRKGEAQAKTHRGVELGTDKGSFDDYYWRWPFAVEAVINGVHYSSVHDEAMMRKVSAAILRPKLIADVALVMGNYPRSPLYKQYPTEARGKKLFSKVYEDLVAQGWLFNKTDAPSRIEVGVYKDVRVWHPELKGYEIVLTVGKDHTVGTWGIRYIDAASLADERWDDTPRARKAIIDKQRDQRKQYVEEEREDLRRIFTKTHKRTKSKNRKRSTTSGIGAWFGGIRR